MITMRMPIFDLMMMNLQFPLHWIFKAATIHFTDHWAKDRYLSCGNCNWRWYWSLPCYCSRFCCSTGPVPSSVPSSMSSTGVIPNFLPSSVPSTGVIPSSLPSPLPNNAAMPSSLPCAVSSKERKNIDWLHRLQERRRKWSTVSIIRTKKDWLSALITQFDAKWYYVSKSCGKPFAKCCCHTKFYAKSCTNWRYISKSCTKPCAKYCWHAKIYAKSCTKSCAKQRFILVNLFK